MQINNIVKNIVNNNVKKPSKLPEMAFLQLFKKSRRKFSMMTVIQSFQSQR